MQVIEKHMEKVNSYVQVSCTIRYMLFVLMNNTAWFSTYIQSYEFCVSVLYIKYILICNPHVDTSMLYAIYLCIDSCYCWWGCVHRVLHIDIENHSMRCF